MLALVSHPRSKTSTLTTALLIILSLAGCHLSIELDDYTYPHSEPDQDINDTSDARPAPDADVEQTPTKPRGPQLLITELMIFPSPPPGLTAEFGEYIEIQNVGDTTIDPRSLVIEILESNERIAVDPIVASPEEEAVVQGLRPIKPGDFFLFLRADDPYYQITDNLEPGTFYEYGRWNRSISLPNQSRTIRLVELREDWRFIVHHEVGWRQGSLVDLSERSQIRLDLRKDIALGLRPEITTTDEAADPRNWCYHVLSFSSGPLRGSPGGPTPEGCL